MNFDDLFDDFFKKPEEKPNVNPNPISDELKKIIHSITNFKKMSEDEDLDKAIDDELGEPDEVEEIIEDGFIFKKLVWHTPHGHFVKIVVDQVMGQDFHQSTEPATLEEQLQEAVEAEDYPKAIELRDKIKKMTEKKV